MQWWLVLRLCTVDVSRTFTPAPHAGFSRAARLAPWPWSVKRNPSLCPALGNARALFTSCCCRLGKGRLLLSGHAAVGAIINRYSYIHGASHTGRPCPLQCCTHATLACCPPTSHPFVLVWPRALASARRGFASRHKALCSPPNWGTTPVGLNLTASVADIHSGRPNSPPRLPQLRSAQIRTPSY